MNTITKRRAFRKLAKNRCSVQDREYYESKVYENHAKEINRLKLWSEDLRMKKELKRLSEIGELPKLDILNLGLQFL